MYSVAPYEDHNRSAVVRMLGAFWNCSEERSSRFFNWKYLDNPCVRGVAISLLFYEDVAVGMRGAGFIPFRIDGNDREAACLGDSWIDPEHRANNQFHALTACLEETLVENGHHIILNMSASKRLLDASLANGWKCLASTKPLSRRNSNPDKKIFTTDFEEFDRFFSQPMRLDNGTMISSHQLFTNPVLALQQSCRDTGVVEINRTEDYLNWRYLRPGSGYRFLYIFEQLPPNSQTLPPLTGFIVVCLPEQANPGDLWVVDYLYRDLPVFIEALGEISDTTFYRSINIQDSSELRSAAGQLSSIGFIKAEEEKKKTAVLILDKKPAGHSSSSYGEHYLTSELAHYWPHHAINLDGI